VALERVSFQHGDNVIQIKICLRRAEWSRTILDGSLGRRMEHGGMYGEQCMVDIEHGDGEIL
jgi:hypothetical protein